MNIQHIILGSYKISWKCIHSKRYCELKVDDGGKKEKSVVAKKLLLSTSSHNGHPSHIGSSTQSFGSLVKNQTNSIKMPPTEKNNLTKTGFEPIPCLACYVLLTYIFKLSYVLRNYIIQLKT